MRVKIPVVITVSILCILTTWLSVYGDVLHLKDGTKVYGTVTETTQATVTIVTASGTRTYPMSSVSYIEREGTGTPSQPSVVVTQEQKTGLFGSSLTMEQEWNNAVYYAAQREGKWCAYRAKGYGGMIGGGLIGVLGLVIASVPDQFVGFAGYCLVGVGIAFAIYGMTEVMYGPRRCQLASSETKRLMAIGEVKGWQFLGRLIEPPTLRAKVIVKEQDSVLDWIKFFSGLAD